MSGSCEGCGGQGGDCYCDDSVGRELECKKCHNAFSVDEDYEMPDHGLCWPCASEALSEALKEIKFLNSEYVRHGGEWLGAARNWVQWNCRNGEHVTWGSNDVLQPPLTIRQVENLAARVADAANREHDTLKAELEKLRRKHLRLQIGVKGDLPPTPATSEMCSSCKNVKVTEEGLRCFARVHLDLKSYECPKFAPYMSTVPPEEPEEEKDEDQEEIKHG